MLREVRDFKYLGSWVNSTEQDLKVRKALEKSLDGCYTRMLRAVLNISRTAHATNKSVYEGIPKVSQKIAVRRMKLAGHCQRHQ